MMCEPTNMDLPTFELRANGEKQAVATNASFSRGSEHSSDASFLSEKRQRHIYPDDNADTVLPKVLVLYFPQYHKSELNDRLWGDNFTDWVNLKEAPLFNRKEQRIIRPTEEFGYYDLNNYTIRKMQGDLARKHSVDGFVYHHYWFYDDTHPGPSLHAPLMKMLEDGEPNLPFCLHWVAQDWTATWNRKRGTNDTTDEIEKANEEKKKAKKAYGGEGSEKLLQAQYAPTDESEIAKHYKWLAQFFHHPNYIKVNGMPVFMLYRQYPGVHNVIATLKQMAIKDGFPGLHCIVGHYATNDALFEFGRDRGFRETLEGDNAIFDRVSDYPYPYDWTRRESLQVPSWCLKRAEYGEKRQNNVIGIVTSFDNTPRRDARYARLWVNKGGEKDTLKKFGRSLWSALYYLSCCHEEAGNNQFILINAWNEWAEGMAMEPSDVYQTQFLETLRGAKHVQFKTCARAGGAKQKSY
jgi:hypothetical protein